MPTAACGHMTMSLAPVFLAYQPSSRGQWPSPQHSCLLECLTQLQMSRLAGEEGWLMEVKDQPVSVLNG